MSAPMLAQAQTQDAQPTAGIQSGDSLTIGKDFAVVRTPLTLALSKGFSEVTATNVTRHLETDSVVLRNSKDGSPLAIAEQNYDGAITSEQEMLSKYEGQTLDFRDGNGKITHARVLRATQQFQDPATGQYIPQLTVLDVDGKVYYSNQFGQPVFPADAQQIALFPTLRWKIYSDKGGAIPAELSYLSGGFGWEAAYNVVLTGAGDADTDPADIVGWLTIKNESGITFDNAHLRLFAGDIIQARQRNRGYGVVGAVGGFNTSASEVVTVMAQQHPLDEYHFYDVPRATTLRDHETKQVEFLQASGVQVDRSYEYSGQDMTQFLNNADYLRTRQEAGKGSNTKVAVVHSISNKKSNHLGEPMPAGLVRFYREGPDKALEFIGDGDIGHTPADETIRIVTGAAFDIVGERTQTHFYWDERACTLDESFKITLRNHKKKAVSVNVIEEMFRYANWKVSSDSHYDQRNSNTVVFPVPVAADGTAAVDYNVHYSCY